MSQSFFYLLVHLAALAVVVSLWKHAPDLVQKTFLLAVFGAMSVYLFCDVLELMGVDNRTGGTQVLGFDRVWPVKNIAGAVAHAALLTYLVRQWWIKTKMCEAVKGRGI